MTNNNKDKMPIDDTKKKKKKEKEPSVPIHKLFRFATPLERLMIVIAIIFSAGSGALQPISIIIFGSFINNLSGSLDDTSQLLPKTLPVIHIMAYMGTAVAIAAYISNCFWILTGENQTRRIRTMYVHSVLRQDMGWFDKSAEGSLTTRLATDTQIIQDGISEKFGRFVMLLAQFLAGFIVAFIKGWRLAVIMLAVTPLLLLTGGAMGIFMTKYTLASQNAYAAAGSIAEQVFNSIRTVYSFSLQKRFLQRYEKELDNACKTGIKRGASLGIGIAFFMFFLFGIYSLALWYGAKLVSQEKLTGSVVLVVFLSMIMGSMSLLQLPNNLSAVSSACGAAYKIFATIDRVPEIDPDSDKGLIPDSIKGAIEFKNVMFKYPTRPDLTILKDLSLKIEPGMTVAFVGPSGSGKSTSVQLVQRFYDPLSGSVTLDGHDLKDISVKWLRQNIGVVGQEPVLFNMTIRQNLIMGSNKEVTEEEIVRACKEANCHSFISQLPQGYDTLVGEHGGMLSGGQKQRIAIARAILKNPTILLLDEATSALDTQSERLVQSALDKASASRTTIVVAHRLSTIVNADLIVVMDHGDIIERGTHNELIKLDGVYADLVKKQAIDTSKDDVSDNDNPELLLQQEQFEINIQKHATEKEKILNLDDTESTFIDISNEKQEFYQNRFNFNNSSSETINAYDLKLKRQKEEKKLMKKQKAPMLKVIKQMRPEWPLIGIGIIGAAIAGAVFPLYSYFFSKVIVLITVPGQDINPGPMKGGNLYAFVFFILGIFAFIGFGSQVLSFETSGERYTKRLRAMIFAAYMRQEIGFFDRDENNAGALTSKLAVDARNVNEMITKVWGDVTQLITTAIVGLIIAFVHSWSLTLIILIMSPFIIIATSYESRIHRGFEDKTKKANSESGEIAGEAIREIRTVAALNKQKHFEDRYYQATEHPHRLALRKAYLSSIGYALNRGITLYTNALAFYAGVRLIINGDISFQQMFTTMSVIMTTAESVGRTSVFASTLAKAKYAAIASFEVMERQPEIDPDLEGLEPETGSLNGEIDFKDITFAYPARPDNTIFHGEFNLHGKAGQTIALVGPSGCGKSTTIGMLQRWYDPLGGAVSLDNQNVKSYTLGNLRSHMALVGQEPILFDMTIGENICFGVEENKQVSQQEIEDACKAANIHKFIVGLPQGYDTRVGDKGSQLSGGQKQRIAIARALIRKPRILLLDEATSALDSDSERLVQEALDNILEEGGRTTITIAHRLSTIQNADLICVVKDGRVIEQGTHWELLALNGTYSQLVREQSLTVL
ncbi:P-loop containing nucleoside triphosphate hydrolase protein [Cokeromyces recurvatus]|uniref:P-loop containing nucleoside triphosphate hydrolase protein n=1 Tax=Cokeromyces recurvatus TaxID=90255 RepID=UPI00221ED1F7|nr:P-loop containing nucleoside triphosphate hydrolase protein [Cokeromyces recurvatus]KAI7903328.1 P-loop containing nucleoside triphosphate hydrolase protein [Cokeromyces recurvatus]